MRTLRERDPSLLLVQYEEPLCGKSMGTRYWDIHLAHVHSTLGGGCGMRLFLITDEAWLRSVSIVKRFAASDRTIA